MLKNPTLVARYSHVLWKAPGRTVERAHRAIDSYLESVDLYIQEDERHPSEQFAPLISQIVIAAFRIALSIRDSDRINKCLKTPLDLIRNFNPNSHLRHKLVYGLTQFVIENRARLPSSAMDDLSVTIDDNYELLYLKGEYRDAIQLAKLACCIPKIQQDRKREWYLRIGGCNEQIAKIERDPRNPIASAFYAESIQYYRRGGASDETLQRLTKEYELAARRIQYGSISIEVDLRERVEQCKKHAALIMEQGEEYCRICRAS